MDWTQSLRAAIAYMESHLLEDISAEDVAKSMHLSPYYLQKGFSIMTGYTISEYIRGRRLYKAALDVVAGKEKIIDIAYQYGYETPESFSKAFSRFHGVSPMQLKGDTTKIKTFLPLKISIVIQGGNEMDYIVEKMDSFQVVGLERDVSLDNSYAEIPQFWNEITQHFGNPEQTRESGERGKFLVEHRVGEYGVCLDDIGGGRLRYLIAGRYDGGEVPEGLTVHEFPAMEWAKFCCLGPLPGALQSVNTKIFSEWLPGSGEYEIAMGASIEYYLPGDMSAADYECYIWIPVKKK